MQAAETGRGRYEESRIGNDAAFSMSYVGVRNGGQAAFLNLNGLLAADATHRPLRESRPFWCRCIPERKG